MFCLPSKWQFQCNKHHKLFTCRSYPRDFHAQTPSLKSRVAVLRTSFDGHLYISLLAKAKIETNNDEHQVHPCKATSETKFSENCSTSFAVWLCDVAARKKWYLEFQSPTCCPPVPKSGELNGRNPYPTFWKSSFFTVHHHLWVFLFHDVSSWREQSGLEMLGYGCLAQEVEMDLSRMFDREHSKTMYIMYI